MSRVATIVRQSQGSEDSISLAEQREHTSERAAELGDEEPHRVDLGVHTGFSTFVKHEEQERLDANDEILVLLELLSDGEFNYLVAHEDTRIARDQFYWVIAWHAERGNCEIEFVEDVPNDDLTFRVSRVVEAEMKRKEIEKAYRARERRREEGMYEGEAPLGLQYDERSEFLEKHPGEWDTVIEVFDRLSDGETYADIVSSVDHIGSTGTITKLKNRRDTYQEFAEDILPEV